VEGEKKGKKAKLSSLGFVPPARGGGAGEEREKGGGGGKKGFFVFHFSMKRKKGLRFTLQPYKNWGERRERGNRGKRS